MTNGHSNTLNKSSPYLYSWAVRDGDVAYVSPIVAAIPEPETYTMLLAGLGLLGFMARRRKNIGM